MGGQEFREGCYLFDVANTEATTTLMILRLLDGDADAASTTARTAVAAIQSRPLMRLGAGIGTRAKLGRKQRDAEEEVVPLCAMNTVLTVET
jgi:hypothetical protein